MAWAEASAQAGRAGGGFWSRYLSQMAMSAAVE